MVKGVPNLKLLKWMHWIYIITFFILSYALFPLQYQLKENFPGNNSKGQICMGLPFKLGEDNRKQRIIGFIMPILFYIFMFRYKKNAMDSVKRQNLNMKTFAQFGGKHHRNLFTLEHVSHYLFVIVTHNTLDNILITVFQQQDGYIDKQTQFILHNIQWLPSSVPVG